jgi:hypothetical protein
MPGSEDPFTARLDGLPHRAWKSSPERGNAEGVWKAWKTDSNFHTILDTVPTCVKPHRKAHSAPFPPDQRPYHDYY